MSDHGSEGPFQAYVFPRPNYVYQRRATVHLDQQSIRVVLRDGSVAFMSSLDDLSHTAVSSVTGSAPYVILQGTSGHVRLGFSSLYARNALILSAFFVLPAAFAGLAALFGDAPEWVLRVVAVVALIATFGVASRSVRPEDGPAFGNRMRELVPQIEQRTGTAPSLPMTRFGKLMAGVAALSANLVAAALFAMFASLALRPFAPTDGSDTEGVGLRIVMLIFFFLALPLYYWNRYRIDTQSGRDPETEKPHINWGAGLAPIVLAAALLATYVFRRWTGW